MDFKIASVKSNRISQNIVEQIRQAILGGDLKIGDRLPSETEFARRLDVSKSSLREAYRVLEAYGLLEIRQGMSGGAFIKKVDMKTIKNGLVNYFFFQNPSIREYTQIRTFIEPEICKICAQRITKKDIDFLNNNITEMEKDGEYFMGELDSAFHKKLVDITENSIISLIVESIQISLINIKRMIHTDRAFLNMVCSGHKKIVHALAEHDTDTAGKYMLEHIMDVEKGMLACRNGSMVLTDNGILKPDHKK